MSSFCTSEQNYICVYKKKENTQREGIWIAIVQLNVSLVTPCRTSRRNNLSYLCSMMSFVTHHKAKGAKI